MKFPFFASLDYGKFYASCQGLFFKTAKFDSFKEICYHKKMKTTPCDIIMWPTQTSSLEDDSTVRWFEFYYQNIRVGFCTVRLLKNAYAPYQRRQFFPENWFCSNKQFFHFFEKSARLKPFLEIEKFDFSNFQGRGFGCLGLQILYQLSIKMEAEGRISLISQRQSPSFKSPTPFYEHYGFKGNEGKSGRKYFNPTENSLKMLMSKPFAAGFKMKETNKFKRENTIQKTKQSFLTKISPLTANQLRINSFNRG